MNLWRFKGGVLERRDFAHGGGCWGDVFVRRGVRERRGRGIGKKNTCRRRGAISMASGY